MGDRTVTPRGLLQSTIADVAHELEVDPALIEGRSRKPNAVDARATVADRLYHNGMSPERIARLMKRPRRTVLQWLRSMQKFTSGGESDGKREDGTEGSGTAGEA